MFDQFKKIHSMRNTGMIISTVSNALWFPLRRFFCERAKSQKKLFLIEKGCIRVWFNNNSKDITF